MEQNIFVQKDRMPSPVSFSEVRASLKSRGRQSDNTMALLLFDWPVVQQIVEKLGRYLSDAIQDGRGPAIHSIIEATMQDYLVFSTEGKKQGQPDAMRLAYFVSALIQNTTEQLSHEFVSENGQIWKVGNNQSFQEWYRSACKTMHGSNCIGCQLSADTQPAGIDRQQLYKIVTNEQTQLIFKELCYEEAVVSSRACSGH